MLSELFFLRILKIWVIFGRCLIVEWLFGVLKLVVGLVVVLSWL